MTHSTEEIDQVFAQWNKPDSPGCALAVIKNNAVIYQRGYGMANLEYDINITPATIFHVASISKQFTALAVAMLAHEGKLSLDDNVRRYVPELPDFGATITIRHLIHHTSGLRDQWALLVAAGWRMDDVMTMADILKLVWKQQELNFKPGDEYSYCNTGYSLMALIVERVCGEPFRQCCAERIFGPLSMRNTHFHDDHTEIVKNRAYSYIPLSQGGYRHAILSYANAGATSLFTTVEDLALWDQNLYTGSVGGKDVIDLMHTTGVLNDGTTLSYAFGLEIGTYKGLRTVSHGGADAGYRSIILRFPDEHFSVIILGNAGDMDTIVLARRVADICLADRLKTENESVNIPASATNEVITLLPDQLTSQAGFYYRASTAETLWLQVREGKLIIPSGPGLELLPVAPDRYKLAVAPDVEFHFITSASGRLQVFETHGTDKPSVYEAVPAAQLTVEQMPTYTGRYYSPELDVIYTVALKDSQLVLQQRKYGDTVMQPTFTDAFKCDVTQALGFPASIDLNFRREADARIVSFTLNTGRIL